MHKANQTPFERRVVDLVEELVANKQIHRKFTHKWELLDALHLKLRDWSKYADGSRNIPDKEADKPNGKHKHIRQYLINHFDVNPQYLDAGKTPVYLSQTGIVQEPGETYSNMNITKEMWLMKCEECKLKDELIAELKEKTKLQNQLIATLQQQIKTSNISSIDHVS